MKKSGRETAKKILKNKKGTPNRVLKFKSYKKIINFKKTITVILKSVI